MSIRSDGPYHNLVCFPTKNNNISNKHSMFEQAHIVATIPARWPLHPSYMHTFGITDNYFIVIEQPLSISVLSIIANKVLNRPMINSFKWYQDELTLINVIDRKTGKLAYKFFSQAFFYLHIINQYEESGHIVLDVCSYKDPSMIDCMYIESMQNMQNNPQYANMFRSQPIRFVLPLIQDDVKLTKIENLINFSNTKCAAYVAPDGNIFVVPEQLCTLGCETPRIHYERYLGKPYQYYYAISADVDAVNPGTIIKVDTKNKSSQSWCEANCYPSEPVFVPSPQPKSEDDGIVLAAMVWGGSDTNHVGLIVLDAKTFLELGRAEFWTTTPVPKCLHGWFIPS